MLPRVCSQLIPPLGFGTKSPLRAAGSKLRSMGGSRVRVADNFVAAARTAWRVLRQTAALGCIESSPRRADDGDARECPAARTVEEPAARCGLPAGPHTELPTQIHTPGPRHIARMMPAPWRAHRALWRPLAPRPQSPPTCRYADSCRQPSAAWAQGLQAVLYWLAIDSPQRRGYLGKSRAKEDADAAFTLGHGWAR